MHPNKLMQFCLNAAVALAWGLAPAWAEPGAAVKSTIRVDPRTGRLVRVIVAPPNGKPLTGPQDAQRWRDAVEAAAQEHALDPALLHAVIEVESNYNPYAISPKGAEGLMQLMPLTARRFGVSNSFNSFENLRGGARYLRYLLDLFQDEKLAVAAYNAGEKAVIRYGGIPPFAETINYVKKVTQRYERSRQMAVGGTSEPLGRPPAHRPLEWSVDSEGNLYLFTR